MTDLLEKLWPAFVSEVTEQLDSVELLLARSGSSKVVDVNHLFRNFHTIKGNCSMIGFTSMEALAHRSEDILALVRSEELSMDEDVIDILLTAVNRLKKQFNESNESRENPPQDDELLAALERFIKEKTESGPEPEINSETQEERQHKFSELSLAAKMAVPSLVLGLDARAKAEQVERPVIAFAEKAKALHFKALSRSLMYYLALLKADFSDKAELLTIAAEVFEDINFICVENDLDLGLELGAKLSRAKLSTNYSQQLADVKQLLTSLKNTAVESWKAEQFLQLVSFSNVLASISTLFLYPELKACWRYIKQLVVEFSRGYIAFNYLMIDKIIEISHHAEQGEGSAESFKQLLVDLQLATAKYNHASDEILAIKDEIVAKSRLNLDSVADLKLDLLQTISSKIDQGLLAVEVDIDFRDEVVGEKVLLAVRNLGELLHSRTMFHDFVNGVAQRTSFSLLIVTTKSLADLDKVLSIIDRERKAFVILGDESAAVATMAEAKTASSEKPNNAQATSGAHEADEQEQTDDLISETNRSLGSLKVDGRAIDSLISHVGELITYQNRLAHFIQQDEFSLQLQQLKSFNDKFKTPELNQCLHYFQQLQTNLLDLNEGLQGSVNRIQSSVLDLRVVPIAYVFDRFHKFIRTISQKVSKKIILDVVGEQVKVDKALIDVLSEPLAHMVRNSIDHGIESAEQRKKAGKDEFGLIKLKAEQRSGLVLIDIIDDGAGLDRDKILKKCIKLGFLKEGVSYTDGQIFDYIFRAGFSTSDELSETSGRGVGMDVVRNKITAVGGSISVESTRGVGTTIRLKLPISAAIQSVVLVENQKQILAIPERFVAEVISLSISDVQLMQGQSVAMLRNSIVPLYRLDKLLASAHCVLDAKLTEDFEVLIIANEQHMFGLLVDNTLGRTEVLVREAHATLKYMAGVSGAAILGDGSVVIILDCEALFKLALKQAQNLSTLLK